MAMILYGSSASPFVRRIRMLLEGQDYTFTTVNVYDDAERASFAKISPIKKLPLLVDNGQQVFDSHIIAPYVIDKFALTPASLDQLNLVSAVDAVIDSLVIVLLGTRSGIEASDDKLIFKLQLGRIPDCLVWLNQQAEQGAFKPWNYATMVLISLLDWAEFRQLYKFDEYPALLAVRKHHSNREIVKSTMPV